MLRIEIGPDDLAASRFGIAPLTELDRLIRRFGRPGHRTRTVGTVTPPRWAARYRDVRDDVDLRVVRALQTTTLGSGFPVPAAGRHGAQRGR